MDATTLLTQALIALQAGEVDRAMDFVKQYLEIDLARQEYLTLKGMLERRLGRGGEAFASYQKALLLEPKYADAHANLGNLFRDQSEWQKAIDCYRKAVTLRPENLGWWGILSDIFRISGKSKEADAILEESLAYPPGIPEAWVHRGNTRLAAGDPGAAVLAYRSALALRPKYSQAAHNLGVALTQAGWHREAVAEYRKIIEQSPKGSEDPQILFNLAVACHRACLIGEAEIYYRAVLERNPENHTARWNLALILLLAGKLEAGFQEYESRYMPGYPQPPRSFGRPRWQGEHFAGRRILVYAEQGFGDTLQMLRYLPLVAERGGEVVLESDPALVRLVRPLPEVREVVSPGDPMPKIDLEVSLMSLPWIFKTRLDTIPAKVPYLTVSRELEEQWHGKVRSFRGPRIGFVWAGKPSFQLDTTRSPRLSVLLPLLQRKDATYFLLQKGDGRRDLWEVDLPENVIDMVVEVLDFADTAAILTGLDLLITSCTSMVHLAGALGIPTWVLLNYEPDWRWMLKREDTPWYPSVRLFRQPIRGRWDLVVEAVRTELVSFKGK
ncbi:Tetratricopeptide repeat protein [Gammaproteobacteria bacterium]